MSVLVLILPSSSQIQNPEQLARTGQGRLAQERSTDVAELEVLRQREMAEKRTRALQRSNRWVRALCSAPESQPQTPNTDQFEAG